MLAVIDALILNVAFIAALSVQVNHTSPLDLTVPYVSLEALFFAGYSLLIVLIFQHNNLYKINVFLTIADHSVRIGKSMVYAVLGLGLVSFFTKSSVVVESRLVILAFTVLSLLLFAIVRVFAFRKMFLLFAAKNIYRRSVIIIGAGATGKLMAATVQMNNPYGITLLGFLDDEVPEGSTVFGGSKVLGRPGDVEHLVRTFEIDELLVCLDDVPHERLLEVLDLCSKTDAFVQIASPLYSIISERLFTERYGTMAVVGITKSQSILQDVSKRLFDFGMAFVGAILLAPVFLVIAAAIKLDSKGPVFFNQTRIGKNGRPFTFYKFRSMAVGSDQDHERRDRVLSFIRNGEAGTAVGSTKIVTESRITRVGKLLRKTSLDELPQIVNVIKGDMSLVGPRPCLPYEWDHYDEWHRKRLSVTPGCTGVWQVSGRSVVGFDDMVVLDLYYIQNASLALDAMLILKTIPVMLFGKGAK